MPERVIMDAATVEAVARWRDLYDALFHLWLDSAEYETFASTQLATASSPVNQRGLELAARLRLSHPTYYWWFSDGPVAACPRCNGGVSPAGRHTICPRCSLVLDPPESAG